LINGKPSFRDLDIRDGNINPEKDGCAADFSFIQMVARGVCLAKSTCSLSTDPSAVIEWAYMKDTLRSRFIPALSLGLWNTNQATPCPPSSSGSGTSSSSGSTCKATLGAASGLSNCVDRGALTNIPYAYRNATGFRLMLVATCSLEEFMIPSWLSKISVGDNNRTISRSTVSLIVLITSVFIAIIFLFASRLLFKRESQHSSFATTPSDYTIMVTWLPNHKSLSELERTIRRHFEVVLRNEAPDDATEDEKMTLAREEESICEIADINFGIKDSKGIFDLFRSRGSLLHDLERLGRIELIADADNDLKKREVARLQIMTIIDKLGLCDKEIDKRRGEAVVLEDEDGHFVGKLALKATAAFVTFNHQDAASRAIAAYPTSLFRWICMPRRLQMTEPSLWRPWVTRAPDPSDIYWSNLPITIFNRMLRRFINLSILTASLFVALAIVFLVAQSKQDFLRKYPVVDCPALLQSEPRFQSSLAGVSLAIAASKGLFVFTPSDTQISSSGNAFSKAGVVTDVYFKELGLQSGNSGALHCYCSNLASSSYSTSSDSGLFLLTTETFPALLASNSTSNRNDPPERTKLCNDWLTNFLYVNGLGYGSSIITLIINILLSAIVYKLVKFERHWNRTSEVQARALYLLIVQFINTGALVLLLNADIPSSLWLFRVGRFSDLTSQWYKSAGSSIVLTMLINVFLPHISPLLQIFFRSCLRCFDRNCSFDRTITRSRTQTELNKLQLGPEMALDERYAQIFTTVFVCLTYSTGMPLLIPILFMSLAVMLLIDKLLFTLAYRTPPVINADLPTSFSSLLPVAAITQLGIGAWMLSSIDIFPVAENLADTPAVSTIYSLSSSGVSFAKAVSQLSTYEPFVGISLGRRVTTVQALPLFLFCAILIAYILISPLLSCFLFRLCGLVSISDSCTQRRQIYVRSNKSGKRRNAQPTYFLAIPPDDVEAAAKGARDIKPELKEHYNKAYEEQSKGKAREQLTMLVEKYERFNSIALAATRTIDKAVDAITESSTEINRLTEAGVMPASSDQILADSQNFAIQAAEDLERALTLAKSFSQRTMISPRTRTNSRINEEEEGEKKSGNEKVVSTTADLTTMITTSDEEIPSADPQNVELVVVDDHDNDDLNKLNGDNNHGDNNHHSNKDDDDDYDVNMASPRSPSPPLPSLRRRSSLRKSLTSSSMMIISSSVETTTNYSSVETNNDRRASGGNPFGPSPLSTAPLPKSRRSSAGNPFAESVSSGLAPLSASAPKPPSVLPPVTPLGNPFGSPLEANSNTGDAPLNGRRNGSSRRSSRVNPPEPPPALTAPASESSTETRTRTRTTTTKHISVNKDDFKGYDGETLGRLPPLGSAFAVNDSGKLKAVPLAPSQRLLIELSAKIREATQARDSAKVELDKATERMKELKKRIRYTIQGSTTTSSTESRRSGKSKFFSSGSVYGYDFHEERMLRHEWGLDADVVESFKRRIDDAERRRGKD